VTAATDARFDVVAVGNALVDVLTNVADSFVEAHDLARGSMLMVDLEQSDKLYADMPPGREVSGGSAANTMAGLASFGSSTAFFGRVRDDQLGEVFTHDLRALGVHFEPHPATGELATGRCLIMVTPDAERTMCTYLGVSSHLETSDVDAGIVGDARITYLEGYLWDQPTAMDAFRHAAASAHAAGRQVALTLSDSFCVERHREAFLDLLTGDVDVLFANEDEISALYETDFDAAVRQVRGHCAIAAVTRSAKGSVVVHGDETYEIAAHPVPGRVVDTTGAGDQYAAGFLHGLTHGHDLVTCGRLGSMAASEVISHLGARPEVSLAELARDILAPT
jgi:sugar/nucleoside kinase (ribokinase family)